MSDLTYRVCPTSEQCVLNQIPKMQCQLFADSEVDLHNDAEAIIGSFASKADCTIIGAFRPDHKTMVGVLCMYDLLSTKAEDHHCIESFGFGEQSEVQDIAFLSLLAVDPAYEKSEVGDELLRHAHRIAKRRCVEFITGSYPESQKKLATRLLSAYDYSIGNKSTQWTFEGEVSYVDFCIKI